MNAPKRLTLPEIEAQVCDLCVEHLAINSESVHPRLAFLEDLRADSLDMVELIVAVEEQFQVSLPFDDPHPVHKSVFTRSPFRIADLAEAVYLRQGTGTLQRLRREYGATISGVKSPSIFSQLSGRWVPESGSGSSVYEPLGVAKPFKTYRRRTDGMVCVEIPKATVEIGCDEEESLWDERPKHRVEIDSYLIDTEPVSTTAYCRFLNSIGTVSGRTLRDWFILEDHDDRNDHQLLKQIDGDWRPVLDTEYWPMILVSWYGANAYSLWANVRDWRDYRDESGAPEGSFLPSEAQWEYAARGAAYRRFPWGDEQPTHSHMQFGMHQRGNKYRAETLPLANVNESLGVSPFGLRHMAGNVWQWCRDWYDSTFYQRPEAKMANPLNKTPSGIRSERGGSWIGVPDLCRSSFRRGRPPAVRGRCLGFRCVGKIVGG